MLPFRFFFLLRTAPALLLLSLRAASWLTTLLCIAFRHIMLRAGLLSPHSKLLPRSVMAPSPEPEDDEGAERDLPGARATLAKSSSTTSLSSVASTASTETLNKAASTTWLRQGGVGAGVLSKSVSMASLWSASSAGSQHPRDARDTERRRLRHKDGRLLRGGVGLTTGLGWSDSEDEDAPSEFTNRLSRLAPALSRKSSQASSMASGYYTPSAYGAYPVAAGGYRSGYSTPYHSLPPSASVSRASSVSSSPALSGACLGAEGRSLSRSTTASQRVLRRTASGGSSTSSTAGEAAGVYEVRESTTLPYLAPPLEMEEKAYEYASSTSPASASASSHEATSPATSVHSAVCSAHAQDEIDVPEYPYSFTPPTPTDQGHGETQTQKEELVNVRMATRSPLFDSADPFARHYRPPHSVQQLQLRQHSQHSLQTSLPHNWRVPYDGRSPTSANTSPVEDARAELPHKTSMPVMGSMARDDDGHHMLPMARGIRPGGPGLRPVSKALPPLPVDFPRSAGGSAPASAVPRPQSRTSSGIPKTVSLSSLRSAASASRQGSSAAGGGAASSVPVPASVLSSVSSTLHRERAPSNASLLSLRSVRSVASVASASTATGGISTGARARPSLPAPKVSPAAASPSSSSASDPSSPTAPAGSSSAPAPPGPEPDASMSTPRARERTESTSSTASVRPLKSAIKPPSTARAYAGGMAAPRARYSSGTAPVGVGVGQTGIAI
ncbi:hypothetical protein JB92DRAFT_1154562 [Gautieria morchelliformis]|nr:hypothetical protein JB92DRAFT_1154562 [Gautieria morchelliformis]